MNRRNGEMGQIGGAKSAKTSKMFPPAPTIRSIEKMKKQDVNKKRKDTKTFELDILTAPGKPMRSVPRLKEALDVFFEEHQDDPYVTVNELAIAVGYADSDALSKALFDESNPKYTALLRKAYSLVDDVMTKRMLHVADIRGDVRGYQVALERMDKKRDKYDPSMDQTNTSVKIAIEMKETKEIQSIVSDRISALLSAQKGTAIDVQPRPVKEAELVSIMPPQAEGAQDEEGSMRQ